MRTLMTLLIVLVVFQNTLRAGDKEKEDEIEKFVGVWHIASMAVGGNEVPKDSLRDFRYEFTERNLIGRGKESESKGKYFINHKASPKTIDYVREVRQSEGSGKSEKIEQTVGIYKFEGETLVLCLAQSSEKKRPKEFKALKGTKYVLMKLTLVK